MASIKPEFDKRGVKIIGLSVDPVENHEQWSADIEETQGTAPNYPMIGDSDFNVSKLYGMLPSDVAGDPTARTPADNQTVRNVFVIGPDKKVKLILVYPMTTGRNFDEVLRVIDSLQLTAKHKVATPVNWQRGEDVIIAGSVSDDAAKEHLPRRLEVAQAVHPDRPGPEQLTRARAGPPWAGAREVRRVCKRSRRRARNVVCGHVARKRRYHWGANANDPDVAARAGTALAAWPSSARASTRSWRLLSEGLTGRAIARRLFLSPETVRTHVRNATTKLGAKTRVQAVAMLVRERAVARAARTQLAPGVGEQLHQQAVVPGAVRGSLVLPHDADAREPDRLVAADCPLVGGRRVDRQAMVAAAPRSDGARARRRPRGRDRVPARPRRGRGRCRRCGTAGR